jgi:hypothetical protein
MEKLIEKYKANPTEATKQALVKYNQKHMMAMCMLSEVDQAFLKSIGIN